MPPGGAFRSRQTGLDSPMSVPGEPNTWVRTKLSVPVSICLVTGPPARPAGV